MDIDRDVDADDLGRRFARGDDGALEELYRDASALVFTMALRKLGSRADAEDVTQATFVAAWKSRESFDPERGVLRAWLTTIAKRRIADALAARARVREHAAEPDVLVAVGGGEAPLDDIDRSVLVADEVRRLGPPKSQLVAMAYFEGMTHQQISATMDMPIGTVKSHIRRSLIALRDTLGVMEDAL